MEPETNKKLAELEEKMDKIYISVEKTRKYFFWTGVITVLVIVIPLIGLALILPSFMSSYVGSLSGASLGL